MAAVFNFRNILHGKGLKATSQRISVLEYMNRHRRFLSPTQVWEALNRRYPSLGLTSVYRILEQLEQSGLVTLVKRKDRQLYYYFCTCDDTHHHHFVCRECGSVEEVMYCSAERIYRELEKSLGCRIESHFMQIEGICRDCLYIPATKEQK